MFTKVYPETGRHRLMTGKQKPLRLRYGSSVFGRFNQILDPNNDGRSLRRQGRNAHLPSTNDGGGEAPTCRGKCLVYVTEVRYDSGGSPANNTPSESC